MAHSRGASHQTARLKPESPFVEANVIVSHRPASLHLSLSGWYPAVPFSCNSFSVCLHLFSLFIPTCVSLPSPSSSSSFCPPHQLLLTTEHFLFLRIVSASTNVPVAAELVWCASFHFFFRRYLFHAGHHSAHS